MQYRHGSPEHDRAVLVGTDRDRDGDDPDVVRAVAWHAPDGRLVMLGYDIDELEDVQNLIVRTLGLGLLPALLLSLVAGVTLARRARAASSPCTKRSVGSFKAIFPNGFRSVVPVTTWIGLRCR